MCFAVKILRPESPVTYFLAESGQSTLPEHPSPNELLLEQTGTYHIEIDRRLLLVENVLAGVNVEMGERYFGPEIVERWQEAVWEQGGPVRIIQAPVYAYGALSARILTPSSRLSRQCVKEIP